MSNDQKLTEESKAVHITLVRGSVVETGSLNGPYESDTDGCYLCKFGDKFGCDDSETCRTCRTCRLELHQYYR